ncbi:hypothetical protein G9A89_017601 [Geosiphon pyriformis]|nr:hypothetical protein G9A89_017601 [Geosiphon pyriformis]
MCGHFKTINTPAPFIKFEKEEEKPTWEAYQNNKRKEKVKEKELLPINNYTPHKYTLSQPANYCQPKLICINCDKKLSLIGACCGNDKEYSTVTKFYCRACILELEKWDNTPCLACEETLLDEGMWNDIPDGGTCDKTCQMTSTKAEDMTISKLLEIKNNPLSLSEPEYIQIFDVFGDISINKRGAKTCDLIYNPPPQIIYIIPEEIKPISSCTSELESIFNPDSNSDNNDNKNTSSSFIQYDNKDNSDLDSDPNSKIFIVLPDLTKKQELKWCSDNNEDIMPEHVHDTDTEFDLRYPGKNAIKLEPHLHTCIYLKIALEILVTTMVQLASRSSLAKKKINIRGGIIDIGYVRNIIAILQNNSEKAYVIELNKKIAQTIFLFLVKITQLVLMENRKKLGITARGIQESGSTNRVDIPVNIVKEEIIDKGEIISTGQPISIPSYNQYMIVIEKKVKDQNQIFEAEAAHYELREIGLINLHIPVRNYSPIKIPIYNNTRKVIEILEGTIIRHLTTEIKDQLPNPIPDFP